MIPQPANTLGGRRDMLFYAPYLASIVGFTYAGVKVDNKIKIAIASDLLETEHFPVY